MGIPFVGPMTVDIFHALTDTRPNSEKWELIGGEPVLNASPSALISGSSETSRDPGRPPGRTFSSVGNTAGVRVFCTDRPEPDVLVTPRHSEGRTATSAR